jgi:hypothetical protein
VTIRRAVYDPDTRDGGPDVVLIRRLLSELENPPYYPSPEPIGDIIEQDSVWVDDVAGIVCRFHRNENLTQFDVPWLLPKTVPLTTVAPLLSATFTDVWERHADARDWRVEGLFQGTYEEVDATVRTWKAWFKRAGGNSPFIGVSTETGLPIIWWTLDELKVVAEQVVSRGT